MQAFESLEVQEQHPAEQATKKLGKWGWGIFEPEQTPLSLKKPQGHSSKQAPLWRAKPELHSVHFESWTE